MTTFVLHSLWTSFGLAALVSVTLATLIVVKKWRVKKPSPFGPEYFCPKKPIVNDKRMRDAVLSQRFKPNRVTDVTYDTIVIGSGPGSLSTAVLLSRLGQRVLVLEQHDQAGGTMHTFWDKGFEFNTGLHYMGSMGVGDKSRHLVDQLTRYQVDFSAMDDEYDKLVILGEEHNSVYCVRSGCNRFVSYLVNRFPDERLAIERYFQAVKEIGNGLDIYFGLLKFLPYFVVNFLLKTGLFRFISTIYSNGHVTKTVDEYLKELTSNKDLRMLLQFTVGDYAGDTRTTAMLLHGMLIDHFMDGGYYPVGGPSELAYHMCSEIRERGGEVLVCAEVNSILCDPNGRAIGVEVGTPKTKVYATNIVSGVGFANTFHKLLPLHVAKESPAYSLYEKVGPSVGFLTAFVGLDGSPEELGITRTNFWVLKEGCNYDSHLDQYCNKKFEDLPEDLTPITVYITSGSAKDPNSRVTMPGKTSMEVITVINLEWFAEWNAEKKGRRGQVYEDRKSDIAQSMWKVCLSLLPQLDGKVEYFKVGTTATNKYYLGSYQGEIYGMDHTLERMSPIAQVKARPDSGIKGLYLTGSDVMVVGVFPALNTGVMTASTIVNRNLNDDLQASYKKSQIKI